MAKFLLIEAASFEDIDNVLVEAKDNNPKKYIIKGPFIEANKKNKNQRIYPSPVVRPQIEAFQQVIKENRAVGELEHPNSLEINPKNISHKITKLGFVDENIVLGEAIITSTPNGMIVKGLMDEKIKLAVSSRGSGSLKDGVVQNDYKYITNDIVWDPSAPSAFVEGIMENVLPKTEWVETPEGLVEREITDIEDYKKRLENIPRGKLNEVLISIFQDALDKASKRNSK